MIIKDKVLQNVTSPTAKAGQKQEQDVAFYLRRAFKNHSQVFVLNDYKFSFNDETAQIDHLIVYPYGFILIESKSITGEVKVNNLSEWSRSYNSKWSGMASPIKQVELQQKLFREFLYDNKESILSKLFGIKQQSFGKRCWDNLCVVSSNAIIDRESMPTDISNHLVKTEFLVDKVNEVMKLRPAIVIALNPFDTRPAFNDEELTSIIDFLLLKIGVKDVDETQLEPVLAKVTNLKCKKCGEESNYTAQHGRYGRYGYFINCSECNTNTTMKMLCVSCNSNNTKVAKKRETYTLNCLDCSEQLTLI